MDPSNYLITNYNNTLSIINWKYATTYEINKILKSLKTKNSYGYDEIPIKILKLSAPFIISPLTYICNKSLSCGVFPERLKYAIIKPVYKKGDKLLTTNYRPISLLTSCSNIFEKLIYSRLYKHICTNNILAKEQYGFRIDSSTEAASYNVINEILKAMNNRLLVGGIVCDLEKVFDCVNHEILVNKLQFYGITGKFPALIQSYLRGRYQKVLIDKFNAYDDVSPGWRKITNGVPQGLILDPLLFLIHTRVGTLIVATIYLQLIQNRYMFQSFTVLQCSHQHCEQPVASDLWNSSEANATKWHSLQNCSRDSSGGRPLHSNYQHNGRC